MGFNFIEVLDFVRMAEDVRAKELQERHHVTMEDNFLIRNPFHRLRAGSAETIKEHMDGKWRYIGELVERERE